MITLDGNQRYSVGSTIAHGFADAVQIAQKTKQVVKLKWNDEILPVKYSDTPEGLMRERELRCSRSKSAAQRRNQRRRQEAETNKRARRMAASLPSYLYAWALDSDRFYSKALSILMAADALQIAKRYGTAEAIKDAFNGNQLTTIADSGASHAMTAQMAVQIAEGKFPGQDSDGLITHHYSDGKETFNLWNSLGS